MTNKGTPLVELKDISISFGGIKAVDKVSVDSVSYTHLTLPTIA